MEFQAEWITNSRETGSICPVFRKQWKTKQPVKKAVLYLTALGVCEARLNGKPVGEEVLAPGWTVYEKRLQYQTYDLTPLLEASNELRILLGKGWFRSPMPGWMETEDQKRRAVQPGGILGEIHLTYTDGSTEVLASDESWEWAESQVLFSEIYDGEIYDAEEKTEAFESVKLLDWSKEILIPQEGERIREMEVVEAKEVFTAPNGETIVDFGQEITGYVEFTVAARAGARVRFTHGEVLDAEGNFYNENYRSAKASVCYTCREGVQTWHPRLTFFGFRYIRLEEFPGTPSPRQFRGIAVYSELKRTGELSCSNEKLNQLFSNIFWGQKGNFLDVPTDCPQRDERLGWTGDAQVFVKAASYNYDVEKFFIKWLHDLGAAQRADGAVGQVIPDYLPEGAPSAAWGDAATICPWQIYLTYGNPKVLRDQFESMKKWVDYITNATKEADLWIGGTHFGDWLGLDAPAGSYKGSSREDFIASAFYAHSTELLVKTGKVLGKEVGDYEKLQQRIMEKFRQTFPDCRTQTEYVLAIWFGLAENPKDFADKLAKMIERDGTQMKTGFVGTPYLLHVLSKYGHTELAYSLLLREEYPSWLYPVEKGATTIWEHWDGIMPDGKFWSPDMNSFNHYAYGAVADWIYEEAAGIHTMEEAPGFARVYVEPKPDRRLQWLKASIQTRHGLVESKWTVTDAGIRFEITVDMPAVIRISGMERTVEPGSYTFWG